MESTGKTRDYDNFDPEWYVGHYFATEDACTNLELDLNAISEAFRACDLSGERLLDVGTGPVIHTVLTASQHVNEIYLSDFAVQNREYLKKWLIGEKHTPKRMVEHVLKLEGSQLTAEEREDQVRQKVKAILPVDVNATRPLGNWDHVTEFDIIVSSCCIESAVGNAQEFSNAVKHIASLLKKDGHLVLLGGLGGSHYMVGEYAFNSTNVSKDDVERSLKDAGLQIKFYHEILATDEDKKLYTIDGYYYLVAGNISS